jgi:hypothetical protein
MSASIQSRREGGRGRERHKEKEGERDREKVIESVYMCERRNQPINR